ncbi:MAG TPA: hypothetical protein DDW49_05640 [Deltaproteobacteria bacterium]|nr:MAG: hypothetical protein A2048_05030 [Deltaproteobacteria bacterium GWA2_45_12]HBF12856.1 hypothetical protein [Deltaproteobacteria bacterium]
MATISRYCEFLPNVDAGDLKKYNSLAALYEATGKKPTLSNANSGVSLSRYFKTTSGKKLVLTEEGRNKLECLSMFDLNPSLTKELRDYLPLDKTGSINGNSILGHLVFGYNADGNPLLVSLAEFNNAYDGNDTERNNRIIGLVSLLGILDAMATEPEAQMPKDIHANTFPITAVEFKNALNKAGLFDVDTRAQITDTHYPQFFGEKTVITRDDFLGAVSKNPYASAAILEAVRIIQRKPNTEQKFSITIDGATLEVTITLKRNDPVTYINFEKNDKKFIYTYIEGALTLDTTASSKDLPKTFIGLPYAEEAIKLFNAQQAAATVPAQAGP